MKKKVLFSTIPSVAFLLTMFVSSTFAWFTDFSINQGNRVQSGNLAVGFSASEVIEDGNLSGTIQDLKLDNTPLFNLGNAAQPGDSEEKYLRIRNEGNIAINYRVDFVVTIDSILAEVILFEIQPLGGSTVTIPGTQIDEGLFIALQDTDQETGGLLKAQSDDPSEFEIWRVKMYYSPSAGNTYNDASLQFEVDIKLNAWQFQNYEVEDFPLGLFEKQTQSMAAGLRSSYRISNQFELYSWGNNEYGRLGIGNTDTTTNIHKIQFVNANNQSLLLENEYPIKVSSYGFHTMVLTNLNRAFSFGENSEGQLGSTMGNLRRPNLISTVNFEANEYFVDVQAGHRFSAGLTNLGKIYAWGANFNTYTSSSSNPTFQQTIPFRIQNNVTGARFVKLAVGYSHFLALTETNIVVGFGYNETYRLGDGTRTDRPSGTLTQLPNLLANEIPVEIYASTTNSFVLTNLGRLYAMGSTIGYGNGVTTIQTNPVLVSLENLAQGDSIAKVFTGHSTAYILTRSNKVYAWGSNSSYQIGNNSNVNVLIPIEITGFSLNQNERIVNLYGGSNYVFATTNLFRVFGWGGNAEYQLGNGTNVDVRTPQLIEF